jgi:lipopolysaccharide transport system ATP-binding protein
MCSDQLIVDVAHVDKSFLLYDQPSHRLWQMLAGNRRTFYREHQVLKDISFTRRDRRPCRP